MKAAGVVVALLGILASRTLAEQAETPRMIGGAIKEPRKLKEVAPEYPPDARRAGLAGTVVLECTIDPQGKVTAARVVRGVKPLTDAAIEAVKQWRYEPTLLDGVAVPVLMRVTVNFRVEPPLRYNEVLESLEHRNERIRAAAARNLGTLRAATRPEGVENIRKAIQALERVMKNDASFRVREAAARSLSQLDGRPRTAARWVPGSAGHHGPVSWGDFVDPLGKCDIGQDRGGIEIGVPPGGFDLDPEQGLMTAPRLLQNVAGDHVAQVTVGEMPAPGLPAAGQPRRASHGAGLLLWQDEDNYVRLESERLHTNDADIRHARFEVWRDGEAVGGLSSGEVRLGEGPTELRLERRGRDLLAVVRQGDEAWREVGRAQLDFPRVLAIGIAAVNTAASGLRASFSQFHLTAEASAVPVPLVLPNQPPGTPQLEGAARPIRLSRPQYPQQAFLQHIEGTVLVELMIDEEGRVARSRVIQSVPGLDEAALECVRTWQFKPAIKDGKAVPTVAHAPIAFRIEPPDARAPPR